MSLYLIKKNLNWIQASTLSSLCSSRLELFVSLRIVRFTSSYYNFVMIWFIEKLCYGSDKLNMIEAE
ncbi:hypothetical protein NC651_004767 [Populus alba x Populus x berolinensis]|nr:hypothetical protein NC651_004767 [Populus alba x Populus x berolinensis]